MTLPALLLCPLLSFSLASPGHFEEGRHGTAIIVKDHKVFPVLWGSELVVNKREDEKAEFAVCRTGVLENCDEGLSRYTNTGSDCAVTTEDCSCWQWVFKRKSKIMISLLISNFFSVNIYTLFLPIFFQEPKFRADRVEILRSDRVTFCAVVSIPEDAHLDEAIAFEFSLQKNVKKHLSAGASAALVSSYNHLPVRSEVSFGKYLAKHAQHYCDGWTNFSREVRPCADSPAFLLHVRTHDERASSLARRLVGLWPFGALIGLFVGIVLLDSLSS